MNRSLINKCVLHALAIFVGSVSNAFAQVVLTPSDVANPEPLPVVEGKIEVSDLKGKREGPNLFHSFDQLSIPSNQTLVFTSGIPDITRVLARVTGGRASEIAGEIRSEIEGADLFLFNPNGVFFKPGARVTLNGSLFVSTASELEFEDETKFVARFGSTVPPVRVTSSPPTAWVFDRTPASIAAENTRLIVGQRETLSIVGGDVDIQSGGSGPQSTRFESPGGRIEILALNQSGSVELENGSLRVGDDVALADISIGSETDASSLPITLSASGVDSGTIRTVGNNVTIFRSNLLAESGANADVSNFAIDLRARDAIEIGRGSRIRAAVSTDPPVGDIRIRARRVRLDGGAEIMSITGPGSMPGPDIVVGANQLMLDDRAVIAATTISDALGGDLILDVGTIAVRNEARIATVAAASGRGGDLRIDAERVDLGMQGLIVAATQAAGNGGDLHVNASSILLSDTETFLASAADVQSTSSSIGLQGNIFVRAQTLDILDGASLISTSRLLTVASADVVQAVSSVPPVLSVQANQIRLIGSLSEIAAPNVLQTGARISLQANALEVIDGGLIRTSSSFEGDGGLIEIAAERIRVSGSPSLVTARALSTAPSAGDGGDIFIATSQLEVSDGAIVSVETLGPGNAGTLRINDPEHRFTTPGTAGRAVVRVSDGQLRSLARLRAGGDPTLRRDGGDIFIAARDLIVENGGAIAANNAVRGDAGNIRIALSGSIAVNGGEITTDAADGLGGNIWITSTDRIALQDAGISASVTTGTRSGGNVTLASPRVVSNASSVTARAEAGRGGDIFIIGGRFLRSASASLDASSNLGVSGEIIVQSPEADLSNELTSVIAEYVQVDDTLHNACTARRSLRGSLTVMPRVVRIGRNGVRSESDGVPRTCDAP